MEADVIINFSAPLDIASGGTDATTPAGALVNLAVPMGTIEEVVAGPGLIGGGDLGSIGISVGNVSILQGGTGQTTAVNARNALGAAPLASPNFTGVPRATGAAPPTTDNSDRIATTAWVTSALAGFTPGGPALVFDAIQFAGTGTAVDPITIARISGGTY